MKCLTKHIFIIYMKCLTTNIFIVHMKCLIKLIFIIHLKWLTRRVIGSVLIYKQQKLQDNNYQITC